MKIVIFCHSLASCWNHGNAHFLRGVVSDMIGRGFQVRVFEPADGWSSANLARDHGRVALRSYQEAYPRLRSTPFLPGMDLDWALEDADVVLVHEWNDPDLVAGLGEHRRKRGGYQLFFHDTHHRSVTAPHEMQRFDLSEYDGVLAFGSVIRDLYMQQGWARCAWTWHEAADPRVFRPMPLVEKEADLVWVGNWGDDERTAELQEFLIEPVRELGLRATVYGVRYPESAIAELKSAGIEYGGWLPNHRVPEVFAKHRMTVHVPRRPYVEALPGIPTIRMFEAMACGIPLVSAYWDDSETLFYGNADYIAVCDGSQMKRAMRRVLDRPVEAARRAEHARHTVLARHTCHHRVSELLEITEAMDPLRVSSLKSRVGVM